MKAKLLILMLFMAFGIAVNAQENRQCKNDTCTVAACRAAGAKAACKEAGCRAAGAKAAKKEAGCRAAGDKAAKK